MINVWDKDTNDDFRVFRSPRNPPEPNRTAHKLPDSGADSGDGADVLRNDMACQVRNYRRFEGTCYNNFRGLKLSLANTTVCLSVYYSPSLHAQRSTNAAGHSIILNTRLDFVGMLKHCYMAMCMGRLMTAVT